jgi:hypothetical protein
MLLTSGSTGSPINPFPVTTFEVRNATENEHLDSLASFVGRHRISPLI